MKTVTDRLGLEDDPSLQDIYDVLPAGMTESYMLLAAWLKVEQGDPEAAGDQA